LIKKPFPYVNNPGNQSDGVLKDVADLYGKSLRVSDAHSVVDRHFSHLVPTYNIDNLPTRVKYYHVTEARRTTFTLGMADTLSGKYFKCYTAPDNHLFTFWFNLDSGSTQPVVANTHTYIEINVATGDSPNIVGLALKLAIEGLYSNYFYCLFDDTSDANIEIITSQMGVNTASDSGTTGFPMMQIAGAQELIQDIEIEYSGQDPLFQGQVLKGYLFNIYAGKFEPAVKLDGASISVGDVLIKGTIDGTTSGTPYGWVYNLRQQILASHDRDQDITYADFGTKNERITQIDYTSPTFPSIIARKSITYTLVSGRYRRDSITWTII
jgi:hypothetical protein